MEGIKKINVPMSILLLVALRMLFPDASIALSIFGLGTLALYGYSLFLSKKYTKSLDEKVREELNEMKSLVSGMAVKQNVKPNSIKDGQRFF